MISVHQVIKSLSVVNDPEIGKSLVELGMIRDVKVENRNISLKVFLTIPGSPLNKQKIKTDILFVLSKLGFKEQNINIIWSSMTIDERKALVDKLQQNNKEATPNTRPVHIGRPIASWLQEQEVVCIAVVSGKGGVGKSTVAANLAVSMARLGADVGLIDADIYGFSIPQMMNIQRRPVVIGESVSPVIQHGVQVMSMGFFVEDNTPVIWRGPMLGKMLRNFFADVKWQKLTHLIIDLPPGTGDVALDVHQMIPQCKQILVTTPHPSASHVAIRAGTMALYKTKHELLGVVENMSWYENRLGEKEKIFGQDGGKKVAKTLGISLLEQIPLAPITQNDDQEIDDYIYSEDHSLGVVYKKLAKKVLQKTTKEDIVKCRVDATVGSNINKCEDVKNNDNSSKKL